MCDSSAGAAAAGCTGTTAPSEEEDTGETAAVTGEAADNLRGVEEGGG